MIIITLMSYLVSGSAFLSINVGVLGQNIRFPYKTLSRFVFYLMKIRHEITLYQVHISYKYFFLL